MNEIPDKVKSLFQSTNFDTVIVLIAKHYQWLTVVRNDKGQIEYTFDEEEVGWLVDKVRRNDLSDVMISAHDMLEALRIWKLNLRLTEGKCK